MLTFNEFNEYLKENITNVLSDDLSIENITLNTVKKNNETLTAITILESGKNVAPSIYLNGYYNDYLNNERPLSDIIDDIVETYMVHKDKGNEYSNMSDLFKNPDWVKDRFFMTLINRERNEELLSEIPFKEFEDLAIIFKVLVDNGPETASITIRNEHLSFWNLSVEELYKLAFENTKKVLPVKIQTMAEIMADMGFELEMPADASPMYVISNESNVNGAASILYLEELRKIAEKCESNLYILPSSIHECIVVPSSTTNPEDLKVMVGDVNDTQVALDEQLSNNVYCYDLENNTLTLA